MNVDPARMCNGLEDAVDRIQQTLGKDLDVGLPLEDCLRMASLYPAMFIGVGDSRGRIRHGYRADLVHLDDALAVRGVWVGGRALGPG